MAGKPKVNPIVEDKANQVSKKDKMAAAVAGLNKRFGATTIGTLTQKADDFKIEFIPTESMSFNNMLYGGFVKGRISEVYGPPDSGKTSIILATIGYNMQQDPDFTAGWFETEGHFDANYAINTFGIDPDRFFIWSMEDYGAEKGLDILESLLRSGAYNLMCVNTVAGLTPKKEMDDSMEDQNIGLQARMMSKLMRKIAAIAAKQRTHVAFVNQVRANVGTYGGGDVPAGGKALAFWARQRIYMRNGFLEEDDKKKGYDPERFKRIDVSVKKNTCATLNPYKKCTYFVEYGVGIDTIGELPELAIASGIITLRGSWHYEYVPGTDKVVTLLNGDLARWQGAGAFRTYLRENPDYVASLRARVSGEEFLVESMSDDEIIEAKAEEEALTADIEKEESVTNR